MLRFTLAALLPIAAAFAGVEIKMERGAFQVTGWVAGAEPSQGWASVFAVYAGSGDSPAMSGSYAVENGALVFHPKWPLSAGVRVRAVFHAEGAPSIETSFEIPKPILIPSTRVAHVYPSTETLPSNALKLYIYFSAAMQRGDAWRHFRIIDEKGAAVEAPFLEIDQELWDPGLTRLTVLFDPGRIKRGLVPLAEVGPNIVEGKRYTLVIDANWKDAAGAPLVAEYRKPIRVVEADRDPVDPKKWRIAAPRAGSRDALVITFPKPLDYALLQRMIAVKGVAGKAEVTHDETEWRFTPDAPWKAGDYSVTVGTALEDLAGNRVGRPFDVDTFNQVTPEILRETVSLTWHISN